MTIEQGNKIKSGLPTNEGKIILENDFDIEAATTLLANCHTAYLKKTEEVKCGKDTIEIINNKMAAGEDLDEKDIAVFQEMVKSYHPDLGLDPDRKNEVLFKKLGIEIREDSLN